MASEEEHNPVKEKYLTAERFCRYCKANRVEASLDVLENYEKNSSLLPFYRLEYPNDYVKFIHAHRKGFVAGSVECELKWKSINELEGRLSIYYHNNLPGGLEETLKTGHPFDHAYRGKNPYLYQPVAKKFRPWEEYNVDIEIEGRQIPIPKAEHYYAAWQIFVLDELNQNVKKVPISTVQEWEQSFQSKPEWREVLTKILPSKVLEFERHFQTVAGFRMYEQLIWNDEWKGVEGTVLEGEKAEKFQERTKDTAMDHYKKHPPDEWIRFIRKLIELYIKYEEREMLKLSKELKRILVNAVRINLYSTGWTYDRLCSEVDDFHRGRAFIYTAKDGTIVYPGKLEEIFPDRDKLLKQKTESLLKYEVTKVNKSLLGTQQLDPSKISNLVGELFSRGYSATLTHIWEINKLWFSEEELYREEKLWSHLISLTVSTEHLGREWFPKATNLGSLFERVFTNYKTLKNKYSGQKSKICDAKTSAEFITKLNIIILQNPGTHLEFCAHHALIVHLTRNYVGHGGQYSLELLGSKFIIIYEAIITTLLYLFYKNH